MFYFNFLLAEEFPWLLLMGIFEQAIVQRATVLELPHLFQLLFISKGENVSFFFLNKDSEQWAGKTM